MVSGVILNISARTLYLVLPTGGNKRGNPRILQLVESNAVGGSDNTVALRAAYGPAACALLDPSIEKLIPASGIC